MYEIVSFDGIPVPIYLQRGDEQNIGTGSAQADFRQVPGGGFYRMRRAKKSPQGIRPVTKSCVIWGASAADAKAQLDAWRQKIGVYGRLTVRFFDGSLRWQWAELQDVDTPVRATNKGNYVPLSLTWQTAAQHWNGLVHDDGWTVGDGSFYLGDGTAEVGQAIFVKTLVGSTDTLWVTHNGNIYATNVALRYTAGAPRTFLTLRNEDTQQQITYSGTLAAQETLWLDTGAQMAYQLGAPVTINTISRIAQTVLGDTNGPHGLTTGDTAQVSGGTPYDGIYTITANSATTFFFTLPPDDYGAGTTNNIGTLRKATNAYANLTFTDETTWMLLGPGVNQITAAIAGTFAGDTLAVEFYEHFA